MPAAPKKPTLARTTFGKGSAAKQDAIQKGKVAASKAKLDALKDRQAGVPTDLYEQVKDLVSAPSKSAASANRVDRLRLAKAELEALKEWHLKGGKAPRPATPNMDAVHASSVSPGATRKGRTTTPRTAKTEGPALVFCIDGKPTIAVHNRLSGISRASAAKGGTRLSTEKLRAMMKKDGIADPDSTVWSFTLPNGVVISTRLASDPTPVKAARAAKKAPAAKKAARTRKAS